MQLKNNMGEKATYPQNNDINENDNDNENMEAEEEIQEGEDCDDMTQEEFNALNNKMDELNSALDTLEEKNDIIYSELLKLLQANKEIRRQMESQNGRNEEPSINQ